MDTVRGSADFGVMRSWAADYDGGDLGAVVRASRVIYSDFNMLDADDRGELMKDESLYNNLLTKDENLYNNLLTKDENLYNNLFTRSECMTPAMVGKINEHVVQKTMQKAEINDDQIISKKLGQQEEDSVPLSAATMSVNLKNEIYDSATVEDSAPKEVDSNGLTFAKIPGSKRRKTQQRRIMCVPAAGDSWNKQGGVGVPSDLWAWRKYGQKPIKGSPHPRGYYRCSSSKGCPARKQIERSHTDPTMLVITYTADHNHAWPTHRNALAGSTRQNAFQHKLQKSPIPNTNADKNSDTALETQHSPAKDNPPEPAVSPINESEQQKEGPSSTDSVENSLDPRQDAGFNVFSMHDDDFFADLGVLPEYLRDFTTHSDEETASTVVDPFNLFDWTSME